MVKIKNQLTFIYLDSFLQSDVLIAIFICYTRMIVLKE